MKELCVSVVCALLAFAILWESTTFINAAVRAPRVRVSVVRGNGRKGDDPVWGELPLFLPEEEGP